MARGISRCPVCGEPVSQFAAGCAICGADLEKARRDLARKEEARRLPRPEMPRHLALGDSGEILFCVVLVVLALAAPFFGILFAGFMAYRFNDDGRIVMRNVALASVAAGLVALVLFPFGIVYALTG